MRRIIALLTAPLVGALVLITHDYIVIRHANFALSYIFFSYVFAFIPGILILLVMYKFSLNEIWQFCFAGAFVAVFGISAMLEIIPFVTTSIGVWGSYIVQYWILIVAGIIAGAYYWKASGQPNKLSSIE